MQDVLHDIDIRLLKVFREVAKAQSFSAAAEKLNTSPSNISMNMAQLESRLQMRLCERGVKGFRLTSQGERILAASDELYMAMRAFQSEVRMVAGGNEKEIRIGILAETIVDKNMRIPDVLADLEASLPGVCFHIEFDQVDRIRAKVADGELHCAIGYFSDLGPAFQSQHLYSESHLCYCGSSHELFETSDEEITEAALRQQRIAGYDDMTEDERGVVPIFGRFDSCSRSNEGVLALILTGNYIGLLPKWYAHDWQERGVIRMIARDIVELPVDINVIYNTNRIDEPEIKLLQRSVNKFFLS